jgi:hypothetical protein
MLVRNAGGMKIIGDAQLAPPATTLSSPLRDQAELSGVPNTLYTLHLMLLSVETVNAE